MKPDPEKGIECYVDLEFDGGWNQEESKDPRLVLYITSYVISYASCPIIWASWLQTEIALIMAEVECIESSQAMRDVLLF